MLLSWGRCRGRGGGGVSDAVSCIWGGGANRSAFGLTSWKCLERLTAALMAPSSGVWWWWYQWLIPILVQIIIELSG